MLLKTKGIPYNINGYVIGRVTRNRNKSGVDQVLIIDSDDSTSTGEFAAYLTTKSFAPVKDNLLCIFAIQTLEHLEEDDIVYIGEDGNVKTLYRVNSFFNTLVVTERCNSNCLMCSQPPKDKNDIPRLYEIYSKAIPLIPKDCFELTISGGEPTLMGELFFKLLDQITTQLPNTELHILTNGRIFAWQQWANRLAEVNNPRLMLGIPVYSDYYQVHDYIVQAKDAFNQTIIGLHNLARYQHRIEIRIVLHKQSIPRLTRLAKYIYKNLPFAEHVTFMGLEYTGYTPHNIDALWIDPYHYQNELEESVEFLASQGMNVSIYNAQLCTLPENLWKYSKKSISDWKNDYLPDCKVCDKLQDCGGLFTWNLKKYSKFIHPIKGDQNLYANVNLNGQ